MFRLKTIKNLDYLMLFASISLLLIGWLTVYSASYEQSLTTGINYPYKQFIWICVASVAFLSAITVDYHFLLKFSFYIYGIILGLLVFVLVLGRTHFGACRWLNIAGFSIQPSEFAKIAVILAVSRYLVLDIENRKSIRYLFISGIILIIPIIFILKQPDLGTTLIFIPILLVMLFVSGIGWKNILSIGVLGVLSLPSVWFLLRGYQKIRLLSFLNPDKDPLGSGYSVIQSKIAVGSGGLLGKGWFHGTQNRLSFLPGRHTDFIFSIIGEEWGFIGVIIILALFFIIIASGFNIARKASDLSGKLLAVGLVALFSIQTAVNISMTIGLTPVTGVPLPFLSYGGTSLVVTMTALGILQSIYIRRFMF